MWVEWGVRMNPPALATCIIHLVTSKSLYCPGPSLGAYTRPLLSSNRAAFGTNRLALAPPPCVCHKEVVTLHRKTDEWLAPATRSPFGAASAASHPWRCGAS